MAAFLQLLDNFFDEPGLEPVDGAVAAIAFEVAKLSGLIDALISDPYRADAPQTLALRGSDNQRLHCLTPLGEARFGALVTARATDRALDVMFDEDGSAWLAGIPRRGDWEKLQQHLRATGATVSTSADASPAARGDGGE